MVRALALGGDPFCLVIQTLRLCRHGPCFGPCILFFVIRYDEDDLTLKRDIVSLRPREQDDLSSGQIILSDVKKSYESTHSREDTVRLK